MIDNEFLLQSLNSQKAIKHSNDAPGNKPFLDNLDKSFKQANKVRWGLPPRRQPGNHRFAGRTSAKGLFHRSR
jgi:hypothetical protein